MPTQRTRAYSLDRCRRQCTGKGEAVLWTIAMLLAVLWLLGLVTSNTMGGLIHLLLLLAILVVVFQVHQGRRLTSA